MAPQGRRPKSQDDWLEWFTVSYRTLYLAAAVLVVGGIAAYRALMRSPGPAPPQAVESAGPSLTASFLSLDGSVKVKTVGTFEWVPADTRMLLRRGDLVKTGPGAAAELRFFDGTVVRVRPDSLITIEETFEDPSTKRRRVAWHVSSGEVNFQTQRRNVPDSATEISTPSAKAMAGELTDGGVRVAQSGDSDVRVFRGSSQVETKTGERIALAANETLRVDTAGRPGPKKTLLEAPVLLNPPHQTDITYLDPTRSTTLLMWRAVPGSQAYQVMLDYSAYFNRPLVDRGDIRGTSLELRALEPGRYYWRVAGVDRDGSVGAFSEFSRFAISRPQAAAAGQGQPPPLEIERVDVRANILQAKGRTEPGASLTINGVRAEVATDGTFNEFLRLDKPGRQSIVFRTVGVNGGVAEQRRSVVVDY
jgi:hypothetical protein